MKRKDFVLGEDVTHQFKRNKSPGMVLSVRLTRKEADEIIAVSEKTGLTLTQIAKRALFGLSEPCVSVQASAPAGATVTVYSRYAPCSETANHARLVHPVKAALEERA